MSDNDLLTLVLDRSDKAVRKPPGVVDPGVHGPEDEGGYDLTNPNLHHGADAKYGPTVQTLTQSGSAFYSGVEAVSGPTVTQSFHLAVRDSGPTAADSADQSAHESQAFSLNIASHFKAPAAGDTLIHPAPVPAGRARPARLVSAKALGALC